MSLQLPTVNALRVDRWNFFLLLLSLLVALFLPFKLLLFSYAVLGPLHYLTQIRWLEDRNYFVERRGFFRAMALVVVIIAALPFATEWISKHFPDEAISLSSRFHPGSIALISILLFSALLMHPSLRHRPWIAVSIGIVLSVVLAGFLPVGLAVLSLFVPTLIHVYFFTGIFMFSGYRKSPNTWSLINVIFMALVPILIAILPSITISSGEKLLPHLVIAGFDQLLNGIAVLLSGDHLHQQFQSPIAQKIQSFIAFAYTYHYLNWFSKTSIIGWSLSLKSNRSIAILIVLWLGAITLYLINFSLGLKVLFLLSFLHVILEFPLDVRVLIGLFKKG